MKRHLNYCLIAALMCGMAMSVASCKDDDNNNSLSSEEQAEQAAAEQLDKAAKFWNVVDQLAGTTVTPDDYEGLTLEPTIGEAVSGNETTRRVVTADIEAAVTRYESLVGLETGTLTTETPTYTWTDPDVGTLTYTKSNDGKSLATVDVSISQIPGLRQIVYLTEEQAGTNAGKPTNSYYHFGDVISRTRPEDNITEYWVCVRPSFEPQGKKTSHWVSLSPLPKDKLMEYTSSNKVTYRLPKNLGENTEHMQNLAEMLYALIYPTKWQKNIVNSPDLKMFHDLKHAYLTYLSQEFWGRVDDAWSKTATNKHGSLYEAIFGVSRNNVKNNIVDDIEGLHLIYGSVKWHTWISNSMTLYEYCYANEAAVTTYHKNASNMHKETKRSYEKQVVNKKDPSLDIELDFTTMYTEDNPVLIDRNFFDTEKYHYVIRHATGDDLAKMTRSKYSTKAPITGFNEVYCYTKKYDLSVNKEMETDADIKKASGDVVPAHASTTVKLHYLLGQNGYYYSHVDSCSADDTEPVAIVVATVGPDFEDMANRPCKELEQNTDFKYLLMPFKSCTDQSGQDLFTFGPDESCTTNLKGKGLTDDLNGLAVTESLQAGCGKGHDHKLAKLAWDCDLGLSHKRRAALNLSHGFLPSAEQVNLLLYGTLTPAKNDFTINGWREINKNDVLSNLQNFAIYNKDGNGVVATDIRFNSITLSATRTGDDTELVLGFDPKCRFLDIKKSEKAFQCVPFFLAK